MNRSIKILSLIGVIFLCSTSFAYYIVVDSIYTKGKIAPVYFPHRLHYDKSIKGVEFPCVRCHHEMKDSGNKYPNACIVCHLTEEKASKSKNNKIPVANKELYHNLCRGCHSEYKREFPKIPVECKYCHFNKLREISDELISPGEEKGEEK